MKQFSLAYFVHRLSLVLFLALSFCYAGQAQITYTSANFASAGDTFLISKAVTDSIGANNFTQAGANTSWNFSNLQPLTQSTDRYLSAAGTGYKLSFITGCIAGGGGTISCNNQWSNLVNQGHRELDSIKYGSFSFSNLVAHYNKTNGVMPATVLGLTFGLNGLKVPFAITYQRPDTVYRFPMNYGNKDSCISRYSIDLSSLGINFIYRVNAKRVNVVEGWGALTTPYKAYASTLKLKTLIYNNDTVVINGTIVPVPTTISVVYSWFDNGYKRPVMLASGTLISNNAVIANLEYMDTVRCLNPTASFIKSPLVPYLDQGSGSVDVDFSNISVNADQYSWNFGDSAGTAGNVSTAMNPSHTYHHSGTYMVKLVSCNDVCQPLRCDTVTTPVLIFDSTEVQANYSYYPLQACGTDTVKFTNLSLNATTYDWSFGDNTTSALKNPVKLYGAAGTYTVRLIASNSTSADTISQQITVLATPVAAISPSGTVNVCSGDSVILTASGGNYYLWSNGAVTPTIKVKNAGNFTVKAFNNCGNNTSQQVTVAIKPVLKPKINIAPSENNICAGTPVIFTTIDTNPGTTPTFNFYVNGVSKQNGPTSYYYNGNIKNNDSVWVVMTSNAVCAIPATVTSAQVKMVVNPLVDAVVSISASDNDICPGTQVNFTATSTGTGVAPLYTFFINGVIKQTGTSTTYHYNAFQNGDSVWVKMISNNDCANNDTVYSSRIKMRVNSTIAPSVNIIASETTICTGMPVTFTTLQTGGGNIPSYDFYVNGIAKQSGVTSSYITSTLANSDSVWVVMTSALGCANPKKDTSGVITMTVNPTLQAAITISNNTGDTICAGSSVLFTATVSNEGTSPVYQWLINNDSVGIGADIFSYSGLHDQDVVSCRLVSNATCVDQAQVQSPEKIMTVNPLPPVPVIELFGDTLVCTTAAVYQWYLDSAFVSNSNGPQLIISTPGTYLVEIADSNGCITFSDEFIVEVGIGIKNINAEARVKLFPNPNDGHFTLQFTDNAVKEFSITDAFGRVVYKNENVCHSQTFDLAFLAAGVYFVQGRPDGKMKTTRFTVVK